MAALEHTDRRVLTALRFVDVNTGLAVRVPLTVTVAGCRVVANRRGLHVVASALELRHHTVEFDAPPSDPLPGSRQLVGAVYDRHGVYVPREFEFALPRPVASVSDPIDVALYPSPRLPLGPNWAQVRTRVTTPEGAPVGGALVRAIDADDRVWGQGVSDRIDNPAMPNRPRRTVGEVLVPVAGIPRTTWSSGMGPVLEDAIEIRVEVFAPVDAGTRPDLIDTAAPSARRGPRSLGCGERLVLPTITL